MYSHDSEIQEALDAFLSDASYIEEIVKAATRMIEKQQKTGSVDESALL